MYFNNDNFCYFTLVIFYTRHTQYKRLIVIGSLSKMKKLFKRKK